MAAVHWKTLFVIIGTGLSFWIVKFYLKFPSAEIETVGVVLTITSIFFGLLAGFFISGLWNRYTEVREIQSVRSGDELNMIMYSKYFNKNKEFTEEFRRLVENSAIADEVVKYREGHLEMPYFQDISNSFDLIKQDEVKTYKDRIYFGGLTNSYGNIINLTALLDAIGKDRLALAEWGIISLLSSMISLSVLFLDPTHIFQKAVIVVYPIIISLTILVIYRLDSLTLNKGSVTLEPNQRMFDALGLRRFYMKKKKGYILSHITDYRTEDDLQGEPKEVYLKIINSRKK